MESVPIPPSHTVRELSVVTEEHIQALATRGLLRPKEEVSWRTATGEEFPTEGLDRRLLPRPSLLLSDRVGTPRPLPPFPCSSTSARPTSV
jgi:hypothetical protein